MGDGVFFERLNLAENRLNHSFQHVKNSQFSMFVLLSVTLQICVQSNEKKSFGSLSIEDWSWPM